MSTGEEFLNRIDDCVTIAQPRRVILSRQFNQFCTGYVCRQIAGMAEAGLPGFEFNSWYGVWAPKGLPGDIAAKINELVQETMRDPAVVSRLTTQLLEPVAESSADAKKFIASEIVRARDLLKSVNFEPA